MCQVTLFYFYIYIISWHINLAYCINDNHSSWTLHDQRLLCILNKYTWNQTAKRRLKLILFSILPVILDCNAAEQTSSSEWSTDADKTYCTCKWTHQRAKVPSNFLISFSHCRRFKGCWICITICKRPFHTPRRKQSQTRQNCQRSRFHATVC